MLDMAKRRFIAWLLENHPRVYFRWKRLETHRLCADRSFLKLHAKSLLDNEGLQGLEERYSLWSLTKAVAGRPGALAELGVYRGGSAKFICAAKGDAPLHLFDTFDGMPPVDSAIDAKLRAGDYHDTCVEQVRGYLAEFPNVYFHVGTFPLSATALENAGATFKLVHLDVDLYSSTLAALTWFYPRMERGGLIVTHDYSDVRAPGVQQAFDEFFRNRPETVVPLWRTQAVVSRL